MGIAMTPCPPKTQTNNTKNNDDKVLLIILIMMMIRKERKEMRDKVGWINNSFELQEYV